MREKYPRVFMSFFISRITAIFASKIVFTLSVLLVLAGCHKGCSTGSKYSVKRMSSIVAESGQDFKISADLLLRLGDPKIKKSVHVHKFIDDYRLARIWLQPEQGFGSGYFVIMDGDDRCTYVSRGALYDFIHYPAKDEEWNYPWMKEHDSIILIAELPHPDKQGANWYIHMYHLKRNMIICRAKAKGVMASINNRYNMNNEIQIVGDEGRAKAALLYEEGKGFYISGDMPESAFSIIENKLEER